MEPKAARLRRGEGLRGEQEDRPSAEGEPPWRGGQRAQGSWRWGRLVEGVPPVLGGKGRQPLSLPLTAQPGEGSEKRYSELRPCPILWALSLLRVNRVTSRFPGNVIRLPVASSPSAKKTSPSGHPTVIQDTPLVGGREAAELTGFPGQRRLLGLSEVAA